MPPGKKGGRRYVEALRQAIAAWLESEALPQGEKTRVAAMMAVTLRTLERWLADPPRKAGRPGHTEAEYRAALRPVREAVQAMGWKTGAEAVCRWLGLRLPLRVVRAVLRAWKTRHEERRKRRLAQQRLTVAVAQRDAVWCLDATMLGRVDGERVWGLALRDLGSGRTLALSAGGAPTGAAVVELLEWAWHQYGALPRVLCSDNGPENVNREVGCWLHDRQVIHLRNLPHTPQHNAWAERGMGELKGAVELGKGAEFGSLEEAAALLDLAWRRVDRETPRRVLSWRTREVGYEEMATCYTPGSHAGFYRTARSAVEKAVRGASTARARRRAERGAIYATLEQDGLVKRTRGGVPLEASKATD